MCSSITPAPQLQALQRLTRSALEQAQAPGPYGAAARAVVAQAAQLQGAPDTVRTAVLVADLALAWHEAQALRWPAVAA